MLDASTKDWYSPNIEFIRGTLAFWVLFTHLVGWTVFLKPDAVPYCIQITEKFLIHLFQHNGETHPAVVCFIVLSGYCIHRNGFRKGRLELKSYTVRRVWRIIPIYCFSLALGVFAFKSCASVNYSSVTAITATSKISPGFLTAKLFGLSIFIPIFHTSTFQGNAPLHTVMVEMWLYAVYPLVILFMIKISEKQFWRLLLTIWILGSLMIEIFPTLQTWWRHGSLLNFLCYWWVGAKSVDSLFVKKIWNYKYLLVLIWLILSILLIKNFIQSALLAEIKTLIFAQMIGLLFSQLDDSPTKILKRFSFIGKPSYSLYAIHAPVILFSLIYLELTWQKTLYLVFFLAAVVYWTIEKPTTRYGKILAKWSTKSNSPRKAATLR